VGSTGGDGPGGDRIHNGVSEVPRPGRVEEPVSVETQTRNRENRRTNRRLWCPCFFSSAVERL